MIDPTRIRRFSGFGMTAYGDGYHYGARTSSSAPRPAGVSPAEEIAEIFALARQEGRRVVLRGAGRSYGDASVLPEAIVLDISSLNQIISFDPSTGIVDCEAGVTIEQLWRHCLPHGWWPPVVSGTMAPTLAGALAMNIHGKNNFAAGTLGEHVLELEAVAPNGEVLCLRPDPSPPDPLSPGGARGELGDLISSAGLLAVTTRVKLQLKKVGDGNLDVLAVSQANWDAQFETLAKHASQSPDAGGTPGLPGADYSVSWIDCFSRGKASGRGLIHIADYASQADRPAPGTNFDLPPKIMGLVPKGQVWRILKLLNNNAGMRFLNALKHHSARLSSGKSHRQSLVEFSFLLDYVPDWRKAYLPGGFIQYQSFVPKERAKEVFARQIEMQHEAGIVSFLGVMKRHRPDNFLFSHAVDGYSLALDFKVTAANREKLWALCHAMNDLVIEAGGRFYFAKDSTLRPEDVVAVWGESLPRYRLLKAQLDPDGLLSSALAERLGLV